MKNKMQTSKSQPPVPDGLGLFEVQVYGEPQPYSDVLTLMRCRIFYKGGNRNGCYITDSFAEQLLSTLPYVPIKGIWDGHT